MAEEKQARVLVLGGCGFIGRHFVKYLADNRLASFIKVCDKSMPATSYLSPEHKAVFENKALIKFQQCDLSRPASADKAFEDDKPFHYVFNLCGETRLGLNEEEYKMRIQAAAKNCAAAAIKAGGVKKWVEVSDARVYKSAKDASTEDSKLEPWTTIAQYRLMAEEEVRKSGLPVVILRPATVYGPDDRTGLMPRLAVAATYKKTGKELKFMWTKDLKINVVHVEDVCAAMWLAASSLQAGTIYNLADQVDLDQGQFNDILSSLFGVKTAFVGTMMSNMARMMLNHVAEDANEEHLPVFSGLCREHNVNNTPISPYIDVQLIKNNNLRVNGAAITKHGFRYKHQINEDEVRRIVRHAISMGHFPNVVQ